MQFTSATSSSGVIERDFTLDEITGVLWSPESGTVGAPLLLAGHSGGMHKKAPGLEATARHVVATYGFSVAAIDAPGHGDRPRNKRDQQWAEAIQQARAACKSIAPIVIDYSTSLAERAVPEWQQTLDALQSLPEIGSDARVGYAGVTLGVVTGVMLAAAESRILAASFGGVFVDDALIRAARHVTIPVDYQIPWGDPEFDRASGMALFDAFASIEKTLHAYPGRYYPTPEHLRDGSARFLARHLGQTPFGGHGDGAG
ncbi:alpha/beta hydrolase [Mycolicibacterium sp. P1-5]|uniref:alpha/beta hydrolase n=1 Tax=Mycolicibacterium sp. P1-5 TaxID=2024617 RepID=UPI0011ECA44D|nr:alpha/beta hydrolase [Mycolicibacterium sp. P1-5]KAA0108435.1 alpha/beta hydrolase [Mycolicibacterium sp. P1-5]